MRYNKKALRIKIDYNNMMESVLGDKGISDTTFYSMAQDAQAAFEAVEAGKGKNMMGWTDLPYNQDEIVEDILTTAKSVQKDFDNFVVLGIGGSALGPIAVFSALCHLRYNDLPKEKRGWIFSFRML